MINFNKTLLLTGAGFTKNFGGYLAEEMWSKIFNNPKLNKAGSLKTRLRNEFNFENIYSEVFNDDKRYPKPEIEIFKEVVNEAYQLMDVEIQSSWNLTSLQHKSIIDFLNYFGSFCFTLNQDIVLESRFDWQPFGPDSIKFNKQNSASLKLPNSYNLNQFNNSLKNSENIKNSCIKLHGSLNWLNHDGEDAKVLGINKWETIKKIPLLLYYFNLFKTSINRQNVKLVTIGYSFRDKHINKFLLEAIKEHQLKIFIISPENPRDFWERIASPELFFSEDNVDWKAGQRIWDSINGYFQHEFIKLFSREQRDKNVPMQEILNALS